VERANPVLAALLNFRDWGCRLDEAAARFMLDSEWSWREGLAPVGDR